jgi:phosphatidylserine decarboxylase
MNVFNVHINRSPSSGEVVDVKYVKGSFMNAIHGEASEQNERNIVCVKGKFPVKTVQIAGLIARRIRSFVKKGQNIEKGQYIGLIQFGSRLDIYLPSGTEIKVRKGDKVKAGESILGVREV